MDNVWSPNLNPTVGSDPEFLARWRIMMSLATYADSLAESAPTWKLGDLVCRLGNLAFRSSLWIVLGA